MARYGKEHKDATRSRILATSARRLKADGIDGSGVSTLMKDAGLTNGAFYTHFDSKDDLVAEVVRAELRQQLLSLSSTASGAAGVRELVGGYLSVAHRDERGAGCPSAALLDEIARAPEAVREAYSVGLLAFVDDIVERLDGAAPQSQNRRAQVLSAYALMIGTIQLARALTDDELSRGIIDRGVDNVMALLTSEV